MHHYARKALVAAVALGFAAQSSAFYVSEFGGFWEGGVFWDGAIILDDTGSFAQGYAEGLAANEVGASQGSIFVGAGTDLPGGSEPVVTANPGIADLVTAGQVGWAGDLGNGAPVDVAASPCPGLPAGGVCVTGKREISDSFVASWDYSPMLRRLMLSGDWDPPAQRVAYTFSSGRDFGVWAPEDPKPADKAACIATCNDAQLKAWDVIDIQAAKMLGEGEVGSIVAGVGTAVIVTARTNTKIGIIAGAAAYEIGMTFTRDWVGSYIATGRAAAALAHQTCLKSVCKA